MTRTSGYRRSWRLRGLMDEYLIVRGIELQTGEARDFIPATSAVWHLRGWRGDATAERTLLEAYEALGGLGLWGMNGLERRFYLDQAWTELALAFETGRLALLRMPRPVYVPPAPAEEEEEEEWEDAPVPTTWVGLQLNDEEGEPVAGQRVRIRLPDGTARESVSDDRGRIRLEGIPPGNCQVEMLGMDAGDWRAG